MDVSPNRHEVPIARPVSAAPMVELVDDAPTRPDRDDGTLLWRARVLVVRQSKLSVLVDMVIACGVFLGVLVGMEFVLDVTSGNGDSPPSAWALLIERGLLSVLTFLLLWVLLRKNGHSVGSIGLRSSGLATAPVWGFLAYLTVIAYVLGLGLLFTQFWPDAVEAMKEAQERNIDRLPAMGLAMAVAFSVAVAAGEELLFRGFLVTRLRCLTGSWVTAVLVSSAFFAVLHRGQGGAGAAVIFGLSVILGFWTVYRGNLVVVIVAHALFNATSLTVMNEFVR